MSTPLNTLPLRTQTTNEEGSDISDPMVQDVLNEFQSELMMSQKSEQVQHQQPQHMQPQQVQQPQQQAQQPYQQPYQQPSHLQPPPPMPYQPSSAYYPPQYTHKKKSQDFPYSLIDTEILQKTVIIIIIVILVYHTGLLFTMYEKLPLYVSELCEKFDMYIKILLIFVIIYALFVFSYI